MTLRLPGLLFLALLLSQGCVQRTMYIHSNPTGAYVTMNGVDIGRTPIEKDFTYYGWFDVQVRADGYDTLNTKTRVIAPWWQWPPIDFLAEFWPGHFRDKKYLTYTLAPASTQPMDSATLLDRAYQQKEQLESSEHTRPPATKPATTQPTTMPATTQSTAGPTTAR